MGKLLRFEFKRIRMNKFFWVLSIYCIVWPIIVAAFYKLAYTIDLSEGISFTELNITAEQRRFLTWLILTGFFSDLPKFVALFTCLYVGKDQGDGFIRNKIISGHSRLSVFMSNNIAQMLVCGFWSVLYMCSGMLGLLMTKLGVDLNGGEMLRRLGTVLVALLVMSALFTSLSLSFRNRAAPVVFAIIFTIMGSTVCTAVGMFAMTKKASDSYESFIAELVDSQVNDVAFTEEIADQIKKQNTSESVRGGKVWYVFHPVYQATCAGIQRDFNLINAIGLPSSTSYPEEYTFAGDMEIAAGSTGIGINRAELAKRDGVTTSYGSKCLEYIAKSVIWYVVITGGGYFIFRKRDLF